MIKRALLLIAGTVVFIGAFTFTLSVIDNGFTVTCVAIIRFLNP